MNKGVVMKKGRKYMIVLSEDGQFHKAQNIEDAGIGEEIEYVPITNKNMWDVLSFIQFNSLPTQILGVVTALFLFVGLGYVFIKSTDETYAYVTLQINPSVELIVDADMKVKSIKPLNEDAEDLEEELINYRDGQDLNTVIDLIIETSVEHGLTENGKNVFVGISYNNDIFFEDDSLEDYVQTHFSDEQEDWNVAVVEVSDDVRLSAQENEQSIADFLDNEKKAAATSIKGFLTKDVCEIIRLSNEQKQKSLAEDPHDSEEENVEDVETPSTEKKKERAAPEKEETSQKDISEKEMAEPNDTTPILNESKDSESIPKKNNDSEYKEKSNRSNHSQQKADDGQRNNRIRNQEGSNNSGRPEKGQQQRPNDFNR